MLKPTKPAAPANLYYTRTPVKEEIGKRLKHAREIAGYTQEDAAAALGYTCKGVRVSEIEAGKRPAPPEVLVNMFSLYGVTADYVFGLDDSPEIGTVEGRVRLTHARLMADLPRLLQEATIQAVDAVREDTTPLALADGVHRNLLELIAAVEQLRAKVPDFDEAWPASKVAARLVSGTEAAKLYQVARARGRKIVEVRVRHQLERLRLPRQRSRQQPAPEQIAMPLPARKDKAAEATA